MAIMKVVANNISLNIFPLGRVVKIVRSSYNITNSTNLVVIMANISLTVIEYCAPPPIILAIACVAFGGSLLSTIVTLNLVSQGANVYFMVDIYEKC